MSPRACRVFASAARWARWTMTLGVIALTAACDKKTPDSPGVTPGQTVNIGGSERLGWQQPAASREEIATFRYAIYVDDVRSELAGAACVPPAARSSAIFDCTAPLPAMSAGLHTIEIATFILDGAAVLESGRSAPLRVNRASTTSAAPGAAPPVKWASGMTFGTADGLRLRVDRIAGGLVRPNDIAVAPDGRLFVAEESGRVVVTTPDGRLLANATLPFARSRPGDIRLLSLALDPQFETTHSAFAVYTSSTPAGSRAFTLSRFSESSNAFFGEIALLDGVPSSSAGAASVRVGADGKLFAAFDDGGDFRRAGDLASPSGKVLRLNADGTTPADQAGLTPTYASDFHSPGGFDWQPGSRVLWITDRLSESAASLTAVASPPEPPRRGVRLASYALPPGTRPSSAVFLRQAALEGLRNDLLIASEEGRHLLRVRFDAAGGTTIVATERLLQDAVGGVRVVALGPDGVLYIATEDAVARIDAAE